MKNVFYLFVLLCGFSAHAITIHAIEIGIGKFHRLDNKIHPYGKNHAWFPMVLPEGAEMKDMPLVVHQGAEVYSIFFSSVEELLKSTVKLSQETKSKIDLLTIHAHGLPGGLFIPPTNNMRDNLLCFNWRRHSAASDEKNYDQYYSKVPMVNIKMIRLFSKIGDSIVSRVVNPLLRDPCISGLGTFERMIRKIPDFKDHFSEALEVKFLSCSVALGAAGKDFVEGIASLFLHSPAGNVTAAKQISLGDWSMPLGLGFWDGHSWKQVREDNKNYIKTKSDADMNQKGSTRTAFITEDGEIDSYETNDLDLMTWKMESGSDE